jgi:hypothetical protein
VLVRTEPPPLRFVGLSTGVKRSETPLGWSEGPTRSHHVEAPEWAPQGRFGRPVGSTDPLWAPLGVCFLQVAVLWVLGSVPGVHMFLRRFRRSGGPMDPCEVHVSHSDSSGLGFLGLVTCHACVAPEVAAPPWLR